MTEIEVQFDENDSVKRGEGGGRIEFCLMCKYLREGEMNCSIVMFVV